MKKADLINIIKEDIQKLKKPELTKEKIDSAEEFFNISATNPFGNEIYLYPHLDKGITLKNPQTYISIQENLKTINYFQGYSSNELKEWVSKHNFKQNKSNPNIYYSIKKEPTPLEEIANLFDILAKPEYKKILKEGAFGSATLTTQGIPNQSRAIVGTDEYPFTARPKSRLPGVWEDWGGIPDPGGHPRASITTEDLVDAAEIRYGVGAKSFFGKIHLWPGRKPGEVTDRAYTEDKSYIIVKDDIKTITHLSGYDNEIFKDLGEALGLKKIESRSFAGIIGYEGEYIIKDNEDMKNIIKWMNDARDEESKKQSAFYTREPGTGGTGIDEETNISNLEEQPGEDPAGQPDQQAAPGTGKSANKGPKPPKVKPYKHKPRKLLKKQIELMKMQWDNMGIDIYNQKQNIKYQKKSLSTAPQDQKSQMQKSLDDADDGIDKLKKSRTDLKKQILNMKKQKTPEKTSGTEKSKSTREGVIRITSKSLLNQYENERANSNLKEQMRSHKKQARRQILMEGAMKKFFEYFDMGNTNEEIVQLYAQKGVSVPETFVSKARSQYEGLKKLKLELETSEQNFKDVSKMMVNNASEEFGDLGSEKQLASGLTK